jgi:hypothetical protein
MIRYPGKPALQMNPAITKLKRETIRFTWKKEWTLILILFLIFRIFYSLLGVLQASRPDPLPLFTDSMYITTTTLLKPGAVAHALINVWFRWDTVGYLKVAAFGYIPGDGGIAYMPLYPLLVRVLAALTNNYLLAALIVSNLACLIALFLFYEVTLGEGRDKATALNATFFLLFFPSTFFLFTAHTDSLFLALTLATWIFARRGKWAAAGLLASLATLCRLQGALLSIVLIWAYLASCNFKSVYTTHPEALDPKGMRAGIYRVYVLLSSFVTIIVKRLKKSDLLAISLPAITFAAYTIWLRLAGLGSIPSTLETNFGIRTVAPWTGFGLFLQRLVSIKFIFIDYVDLILLVLMLVLLVIGLFHLNSALSLYCFLTLFLLFMRGTPPHLLDSFNRYFLSLFPAYIILADLTTKIVSGPRVRILRMILWSVSFGLQIFLVLGFLDWRWVA